MAKGESIFTVELSGTGDILKQGTWRSFVILHKLGCSISAHDGAVIAQAFLYHTATELKSLTLFITRC